MQRKILVIGATGQQGGATVNALLKSSQKFEILALTRTASSKTAKSLASRAGVTVVEGDVTNPAAIFKAHGSIYGVFSVTTFETKPGVEEKQTLQLIDESIKHSVKHFVFTSVDRGGPGRSDENPTTIQHFAAKHDIEKYLQSKAAGTEMQWTILRPTAFMENLMPGFIGGGFPSLLDGLGDKPLQLVSCHDIGVFAARAFEKPESYVGQEVSLAGDELTYSQARKAFKDALGYEMAGSYWVLRKATSIFAPEITTMFAWFKNEGYGADIPALRKAEPQLQDFGTWLKESSQFAKK